MDYGCYNLVSLFLSPTRRDKKPTETEWKAERRIFGRAVTTVKFENKSYKIFIANISVLFVKYTFLKRYSRSILVK